MALIKYKTIFLCRKASILPETVLKWHCLILNGSQTSLYCQSIVLLTIGIVVTSTLSFERVELYHGLVIQISFCLLQNDFVDFWQFHQNLQS
jgi:hypothetical protein